MIEEMELERMISDLQEIIEDGEACHFAATKEWPQKNCSVRRVSENYINTSDRRPLPAKLLLQQEGHAILQMNENLVKGQDIEWSYLLSKTGKGESICTGAGRICQSRRISGGYEVKVELLRVQRSISSLAERFIDSAIKEDFGAWNRWCADLTEGAVLRGLNLQNMKLNHFDLCMADLTSSNLSHVDFGGCNLSGAVLTDCCLDGANFIGADLFGVTLSRKNLNMLSDSGLIEVQSISLVD